MAMQDQDTTQALQQIPTQVLHPYRAAMRTGAQVAVALITLIPYVVTEANIPVTGMGAQVVAVAMVITKIMALPGVVTFLRKFAPWLAPDGGIQPAVGYVAAARDKTDGRGGGVER